MTANSTPELNSALDRLDWWQMLSGLSYANGVPEVTALIKQRPEDFIVIEQMDIDPSGAGEHIWLDISKVRRNTDSVAKSLARFAGVSNRDVGYSGMKDFNAVTRQWFSVWRPKGEPLDWSSYEFEGVEVNQIVNHSRKIKRGTHRSNRFEIRLSSLKSDEQTQDIRLALDKRFNTLREQGAPNYFGVQRFGRNAGNMPQALAMFRGEKRIKDRSLRSILLSSVRSWLFNSVVSERVKTDTWQMLFTGEPANLDSSNSVFTVEDALLENKRLKTLDIHPTAPLWGQGAESFSESASVDLANLEHNALAEYTELKNGLESARLDYQRRPLRVIAKRLKWKYEQVSDEQLDCVLSFELNRGQFATSILRELVLERGFQ